MTDNFNLFTQKYYEACANGNLEQIKFFKAMGFMDEDGDMFEDVYDNGVRVAIANGSKEILTYLHEICKVDVFLFGEAFANAIHTGQEHLIKWMCTNMDPIYWNTGLYARNIVEALDLTRSDREKYQCVDLIMCRFFQKKRLMQRVEDGENVKDYVPNDDKNEQMNKMREMFLN